jgi:oligopeptide transport system permease protein
MTNFILKRLFSGFITTIFLITIAFFLMHSIPGGPFSHNDDRNVPQSVIEAVEEKYGLNEPLHIQYFNYMKSIAKGDLGISFKQQDESVNDLIKTGFPISARVGLIAVIVSILLGIPLGIISAIKRGTWMDISAMIVATIGIAVPSFIIAILNLYFFCVILHVLPTYGLESWQSYILPVMGLAFHPISYITRLTRSSMLEVMRQDYIRTARAKGVSEFFVVTKHALKNALIPVVTYLGTLIAALLTGSFVIERIYSIPGIGRQFVTSISDRDYSVILGMTVFFGIFVIISNIVVDVLYAVIDPRVKFE